jgi:ketosteroid isomerase-like protein
MKKVAQYSAEMADREAIRDCLYRYARAVDRKDIELSRSLYWPDASVDFDKAMQLDSSDEIHEVMEPIWESMFPSKHMMGNMLIEIDGDKAYVETYHYSFDRGKNPDGSDYERVSSGRYLDQLERREDEWRFKHRVHVLDWNQVWAAGEDDGVLGRLRGMDPTYTGARKPDDQIYKILKA